jgi:tetratricopeptide (TPR) repeat protein
VFSRGGRAVTVLALAGLAYLAISGLWGRLQTRTGVGLDSNLAAAIESFDDELQDSFDDRPFNFVLWQGDVLVWIGQKPFIDSRLPLYAGAGDDDLIAIHKECREHLAKSGLSGAAGRKWQPALDRFRITHVLPRMDSRIVKRSVSYSLFYALLRSPDWQLARFGASTAVFYRTDKHDDKLPGYLDRHRTDFVKEAFRTSSKDPEVRFDWARGRTFTERWLSRPHDVTPNSIELARNYLALMEAARTGRFPRLESAVATDGVSLAVAFAHQVIRNANAGLEQQPQNADAFRLLGHAYVVLMDIEYKGVLQSATAAPVPPGGRRTIPYSVLLSAETIRRRRFRQASAALQQALIIAPDDAVAWQLLANIQYSTVKLDLALASTERVVALMDREPNLSKYAEQLREDFVRRMQIARKEVKAVRDEVNKQKQDVREESASRIARLKLARDAVYGVTRNGHQAGCVQLAIDLLEEDNAREVIDMDPDATYFYINLLQQAGRARDASEQLDQLEARLEDQPRKTTWRTYDAYSALSRADYAKAATSWTRVVEDLESQRFQEIMTTLPFTMRSPSALSRRQPPGLFIMDQTAALAAALNDIPLQIANWKMQIALTQMETGHPQRAAETLREMVRIAPHSPMRRLGGFYLRLLTGEQLPPVSSTRKAAKPPAPKPNSGNRPPVVAPKPR